MDINIALYNVRVLIKAVGGKGSKSAEGMAN